MVSVLQSAAARGAFKYVQGKCYRTAAEEYAKLSRAITLQRYEMIPETANGIPCTESWSQETGPGIPGVADAFPGYGTMFKNVRIWSNLVQNSALVESRSMELPKTMRIFVQLRIRLRA